MKEKTYDQALNVTLYTLIIGLIGGFALELTYQAYGVQTIKFFACILFSIGMLAIPTLFGMLAYGYNQLRNKKCVVFVCLSILTLCLVLIFVHDILLYCFL